MGDIGERRQHYEVLSADARGAAWTIPQPEPAPVPEPGPLPDPEPIPTPPRGGRAD